jgi:hypothetical protein
MSAPLNKTLPTLPHEAGNQTYGSHAVARHGNLAR